MRVTSFIYVAVASLAALAEAGTRPPYPPAPYVMEDSLASCNNTYNGFTTHVYTDGTITPILQLMETKRFPCACGDLYGNETVAFYQTHWPRSVRFACHVGKFHVNDDNVQDYCKRWLLGTEHYPILDIPIHAQWNAFCANQMGRWWSRPNALWAYYDEFARDANGMGYPMDFCEERRNWAYDLQAQGKSMDDIDEEFCKLEWGLHSYNTPWRGPLFHIPRDYQLMLRALEPAVGAALLRCCNERGSANACKWWKDGKKNGGGKYKYFAHGWIKQFDKHMINDDKACRWPMGWEDIKIPVEWMPGMA